jgi:hypothetical protein
LRFADRYPQLRGDVQVAISRIPSFELTFL